MNKSTALATTATILFSLSNASYAGDSKTVEMKHFAKRVAIDKVTPTSLACENTAPNLLLALDVAMDSYGIKVTKEAELWQAEAFGIFGYTVQLPTSQKDKQLARRALELARHDNLIAAKIANDEAAEMSSSYKSSVFFRDMQLYIRNNMTPDSPEDGKLNSHEAWLTKGADNILRARTLLKNLVENSGVRNYVLGSIYDDGIAVAASEAFLCSKNKNSPDVSSALKIAKVVRTSKPTKP